MFDADSYNWLYHQQLIRAGSVQILPNLSEKVDHSSNYANYAKGFFPLKVHLSIL